MSRTRVISGISEADRERRRSVEALLASGAQAVPLLAEMLDDPSWVVRREVVAALAALGDSAVPLLCTMLCTKRDDEARIAAMIDALSVSSGDVDPSALLLATNRDPTIAADAVQILGRRRSTRAIPALFELIQHPN